MKKIQSWKQLLLTLAVGFVPTAISYTLGWWWVGTIFMLLTLFAVCFAFVPKLRVVLFTLYAAVVIAVVAGAFIENAIPLEWGIGAGWRTIIAGTAGIVLGVVIPFVVWYPIIFVCTVWVMDLSNSFSISWRKAMRFVAVRVFQVGQHVISVDDGEVKFDNTGGLLSNFGGPGLLLLAPGHAVILQNAGKVTRILGPGMHRLAQFENFLQPRDTKGIVDLRPQFVSSEVEDVRTKDGISLKLKVGEAYQLEPTHITDQRPESHFSGGEGTSKVIGGPEYPVYEAIIEKSILKVPRGGWKTGWFPSDPTHILRDVVATYTLEQIFSFDKYDKSLTPDQRIIQEIEDQVKKRFDPSGGGVWFKGFDIRQIEMPEEVEKQVRKRWLARFEHEIKIEQAKAESEAIVELSKGRADALERLESVKLDARRSNLELIKNLSSSLGAIDNRSIAQSFISVVQELTSRIGQDEIVAIRYIEAMEAIVGSEGPKEVILTTQAPGPPAMNRQI
ncbi:MAG: hypothetical protein JXA89_18220 [Anaerolineae bacterium]|nr:hypothetical protein [Anaerolineae bacterium]